MGDIGHSYRITAVLLSTVQPAP